MSIITAILLGCVQGLTEFLPISSDGHLVVADILLGVSLAPKDALGFDLLLHAASLLALMLLTRRMLFQIAIGCLRGDASQRRLALLLVIGTIPGALAGLFFEDVVIGQRTVAAAAAGFMATGLALIIAELIALARGSGDTHMEHLRPMQVLGIGIAQAAALLPGVSRSGLTIATALSLKLTRRAAFDFSFLLAVPIIAGAVLKGVLNFSSGEIVLPGLTPAIVGFITSFIVSAGAYIMLRDWVQHRSLAWFALYLLPLGLLLLLTTINPLHLNDPEELRRLLRAFGPAVIFIFGVIESTPPFSFFSPGILLLLVAGSMAQSVSLLFSFVAAATISVFLTNIALYWVGRLFGRSVASRMRLKEHHLQKAEEFMKRFGMASVIIGQFFGLLRPTVSFVAGTARMQRRYFYPCAFFGAILWAVLYIGLGFVARVHLDVVIPVVGVGGTLIVAVMFGSAAFVGALQRSKHGKKIVHNAP